MFTYISINDPGIFINLFKRGLVTNAPAEEDVLPLDWTVAEVQDSREKTTKMVMKLQFRKHVNVDCNCRLS